MNTFDQITEAGDYLSRYNKRNAKVAVILGSGLGNFVSEISVDEEIPYEQIPHFPVSTVKGHRGRMIFGTIGGRPVIAMAGRFHFYEGYPPEQVVLPVRVLRRMGVETLLLSNAAGAVNPAYRVGDLMIITDHISMFTVNPLIGPNDERLGPRFPDMSEPYRKTLIAKAREAAQELGITVRQGIYVAVTGPTFETHAEYRMIQAIGGDAVGMSTVQEVIAAVHCGLEVFAMSVITDLGIREDDNIITHDEVLAAANEAEPKFTAIFKRLIAYIEPEQ